VFVNNPTKWGSDGGGEVEQNLYEEVKVKIKISVVIFESFSSDIGVKQGCSLSSTLFGLYIHKLEEWLNLQDGDGALLGELVIRLLLYADDLILIVKSALGLEEHLISLEHLCKTVRMQVNTSKMKVVVFSSKRKHNQHKFYFEGNTLEEVADYKYLRIYFNKNLSWEGCKKKITSLKLKVQCLMISCWVKWKLFLLKLLY
jgi:hypothetical protein